MNEILQAGTIPYRIGPQGVEFLLVTSKKGKWIFPKGIVDPGETAPSTALKETREEAGIEGRLHEEELGNYRDSKGGKERRVRMFLLEYARDVEPWRERRHRLRRWCTFDVAFGLLKRKKVRAILEKAHEQLRDRAARRVGTPDRPG